MIDAFLRRSAHDHRDLEARLAGGPPAADEDRRPPEVCAVRLHERPEDGDLYV